VSKTYMPPKPRLVEGNHMAHIALPEGNPGISGGFAFRPETATPMRELADILLYQPAASHRASGS